ncbi:MULTISPECIES: hypothetical protein [unclassified Providencia]|uniref:hypothetical protein n=1 Tax=unclassified Providencia TaxID=2633465 RepID=UPI0012B5421B|nr:MULTISPECIES: hypothetical protein [unclassified Providencia]MTC24901.1 hypothetical protein [Providencia sp. wls1938]
MERKSVFAWANNDAGYVQAVIVASDFSTFKELGFVASVDEVIKPEPKKAKATKKAETNGNDTD